MKSLIVTRAKEAKGGVIVATPSDERMLRKISAGLAENKFRAPLSRAREDYDFAARLKGIEIAGADLVDGARYAIIRQRQSVEEITYLVVCDFGLRQFGVGSGQASGSGLSKRREDGRCCLRSIMR